MVSNCHMVKKKQTNIFFTATYMFKVLEGDKLDNVPKDRFSFGRSQDPVITIQNLHVGKVSIAHTHNDDGHGQVRGVHDGLPRVSHVCDDAIRQDEQDEIFLQGGRRRSKEIRTMNCWCLKNGVLKFTRSICKKNSEALSST